MRSTSYGIAYQELIERVDRNLNSVLPAESLTPKKLHQAMRYSLFGGGKRVRAILVYLSGGMFSVPKEELDMSACAVEIIHGYSLIHDDLPAMDNADLRRNQPSCHRKFDQATAILAGDALQSKAFEIMAMRKDSQSSKLGMQRVAILARACGSLGMAGGQALELVQGTKPNMAMIEQIALLKTGALISAAVELGCLPALHAMHNSKSISLRTQEFGRTLGLTYQIVDDLLDMQSDDLDNNESGTRHTYATVLGETALRKLLGNIHGKIQTQLKDISINSDSMGNFINQLIIRTK